jgi:hypothetical protein
MKLLADIVPPLLCGVTIAGATALAGGPLWACVGLGGVTYFCVVP